MPEDMMEAPGPPDHPDWDSLYLSRGDEVEIERPIFTGDIFFDVEVQGVGAIEQKNVMVLQHPCALRVDGINLTDSLMVAEVLPDKLYSHKDWQGNYRVMPLPFLRGDASAPEHFAAAFTSLFLVIPASLAPAKRIASLSLPGVNLLLQRWVYHNSRGLIPTWKYNEVTSGPYEEADGIEEWCALRGGMGVSLEVAALEASTWLNDKSDVGVPRRVLLQDPQYRTNVRKKMRQAPKALSA